MAPDDLARTLGAIQAQLDAILAGQREILAALPARRARASAADRALVRAVFEAVGNRLFTSAEILDYLANRQLAGASAIREALLAAIDDPTSIRLGKLLERIQDVELDGLRVVRAKNEGGSALWSVVEIRE